MWYLGQACLGGEHSKCEHRQWKRCVSLEASVADAELGDMVRSRGAAVWGRRAILQVSESCLRKLGRLWRGWFFF